MKTHFLTRASLGLVAAIIPLVGGCNQQTATSPQDLVTVAFAESAVEAGTGANAKSSPAVAEAAPASTGKAEAVPTAVDEKPLPPSVKASGPLAEVIKLAQAGVDEEVMLTFITNSTSTFGLTSDEIIYLNDIGVPNNVVTTIIEHDQAMKQYWTNAAQAQAAATAPVPAPETGADQTAAAPSVVTPPLTPPATEPTIVNNNYFYDTLSPYGSWVNVEGYGLCWQPTVVVINRGWQPYCDRGHWVYSDCGWYWLSDYSWGATTFHYGRWFSHPRWGWCWWPDRVWAPSWVTWRYGGDYCGWAPLPPYAYYSPGFGFSFHGRSVGFSFDFGIGASWYTFVPTSRFCDSRPYHHRLPGHQVTQVFNKTTIINNFGAGSHNTVINHGIAPDRITAVTKQEIRKVSIRDAGPAFGKSTRGERLENNGRTLTVHRANIPENPSDRTGAKTATSGKPSPYAPLQSTQSENRKDDLRSGKARSRFDEDRNSLTTTPSKGPGENRTVAPAEPTTLRSRSTPTLSAKPDSQADRSPKFDDNQRGKSRGPGRSGTVSPSVVRGSDAASPPSPAATIAPKDTAPNSSLVVIGKRDATTRQPGGTSAKPAPQTRVAELEPRDMQVRTPTPEPAAPRSVERPKTTRNQFSQPTAPVTPPSQPSAPPSTYSRSPGPSSQGITRQEIPRATRSTEDRSFSRPSYSAPAPVQRPAAPSYSPPPSAPAPTPRYDRQPTFSPPSSYQQSAPRSAPAPSYSPPHSAPAPSYSPPASPPPSAAPAQRSQPTPPSQSDSGRGPRGRNQ